MDKPRALRGREMPEQIGGTEPLVFFLLISGGLRYP